MSPASCEGGGVKSRQPGGGDGDLNGDERGELGRESSEVKVESSESASLKVGIVQGGRRGGGRRETAGRLAALNGKEPLYCSSNMQSRVC